MALVCVLVPFAFFVFMRFVCRTSPQEIPPASLFVLPAIAQKLFARREKDKNSMELDSASAVMAGLIPFDFGRFGFSRGLDIKSWTFIPRSKAKGEEESSLLEQISSAHEGTDRSNKQKVKQAAVNVQDEAE